MARATAHRNHNFISSEDIQGTEVYGVGDNKIGEIDHLMVDKMSGRVAYAVMSFGGFMGWTNISEEMLKDAPQFSDDSWQDRNWETKWHKYYRASNYWEMGTH